MLNDMTTRHDESSTAVNYNACSVDLASVGLYGGSGSPDSGPINMGSSTRTLPLTVMALGMTFLTNGANIGGADASARTLGG